MKPLFEIIDKKNFKRLVAECGGERIWVPKYGNTGCHDREYFGNRNKTIISLRKQGMGIEQLSKKFDLSVKSIYVITKGRKPAKKKQEEFAIAGSMASFHGLP